MRTILSVALLLLAVSCGPNHGTKLEQETPRGQAAIYYTEAVDAAVADKVFQSMIAANYHFGTDLDVQLDKVQGRLTMRICNDNLEAIDEVVKNGEKDGNLSYMRGLAVHISRAIDGEEIDFVLCRLQLDKPYYTLNYQPLESLGSPKEEK